jgi:hypothetical protein
VDPDGSFGDALLGAGMGGWHKGSAPAPFDAINGGRLAGPSGSHPLHQVRIGDLLTPRRGSIDGSLILDAPAVRVGEGITGRISVVAERPISARSATLRLVGLKLVEERRSVQHFDSKGRPTRTEEWVEANGELFSSEAYIDPVIPSMLEAGQRYESPFAIPAPPLGPPTAHLGEAIIAWAAEVHFDIAMAGDSFVAALVQVDQHPDLLRAGVGEQGGRSLLDVCDVGQGTIAVTTSLPARIGAPIGVKATWPAAPSGRGARVELHRRSNAPNGTEGVLAVAPVDIEGLRGGSVTVELLVPPDAPPSFDGAGLEISYVIRVLVDRRLQPDAAIERPVGIAS